MIEVPEHELVAMRGVTQRMAQTWNAGDGEGFAALFTDDAVFVDIKANRDDGRQAIAERHVWLFETLLAGTRVSYDLIDAAAAAPGLALGHIRAHVATGGGRLETLASCVFRHQAGGWKLLMFHNTEIGHYGV